MVLTSPKVATRGGRRRRGRRRPHLLERQQRRLDVLLELSTIIDDNTVANSAKDGRSLMWRRRAYTHGPARPHLLGRTLDHRVDQHTLLSPDARAAPSSSSAPTAQATVDNTFVFVLKPRAEVHRLAIMQGVRCRPSPRASSAAAQGAPTERRAGCPRAAGAASQAAVAGGGRGGVGLREMPRVVGWSCARRAMFAI